MSKPICSTCRDTHRMFLGEDEDREVMCTFCPVPCERCRVGGNGPYCTETPCGCECHGPKKAAPAEPVSELAAARGELDHLAKFKAYVHERLDKAGVPVDPPSPHREQGCRIGGRLDHVLGELAKLREDKRLFPIQDEAKRGKPSARRSIPWAMIAPQEAQALRNHDQSLQRLAERGGLSPAEAIGVLEGRSWRDVRTMSSVEAREHLNRLVAAWEAEHGASAAAHKRVKTLEDAATFALGHATGNCGHGDHVSCLNHIANLLSAALSTEAVKR